MTTESTAVQRATTAVLFLVACGALFATTLFGAEVQKRYYAHEAVHDRHGVIAPWYTAPNGQLDFRIRVAAETLKRYPWVTPPQAAGPAPHYVFNGHWKISPAGEITPIPINDWDNGDLGQRASYVLSGMVDYYRYTGDAAAIAIMTAQADALLDHCLTPADHPWPKFLISVPIKGKAYAKCDPKGMIQLDIVAEVGLAMLKAYQVTGNQRWFDACKHWGDLMAAKRTNTPGQSPWNRYANPEAAPWKDTQQTGGVAFLLYFFDELIRLGHRGPNNQIVAARDAGRAYLRDVLLPLWTVNDTWGRNYWDWNDPVQAENVTEFAARYMMDNKDYFPNWRNDVRNILGLFLHRTGVSPDSRGEMYSGAWAYPESSGCCGRSLWYGPMELAVPWAQYAVEAKSPWAREITRRKQILATYDGHETGVSEDNLDGGFVVNADWFKIAHPMALKHLLGTIAWMPEEFGAAGENHIVNSTAVVREVRYSGSGVSFSTFDAPPGTVTVLRLAHSPGSIGPWNDPLRPRNDLKQNGYTVKSLPGGDCLVSIRHDGRKGSIVVFTEELPSDLVATPGGAPYQRMTLEGSWKEILEAKFASEQAGATASVIFKGNEVRLMGDVARNGGLADVYLDGKKQLVGIDCWNPAERRDQTLYYRNGLPDGAHTLKIVVLGKKNPVSSGTKVFIRSAEWWTTKAAPAVEGACPTDAQGMVFGYGGREDIKDSAGHLWRPATEWIVRTGNMGDSVAAHWWSDAVKRPIAGTQDADLYRYGVHAKEMVTNVTVGPGTYHVRLKLAATRKLNAAANCVTIAINGREVVRKMDVTATAGGPDRACDLVFNDIAPRNGAIDVRLTGGDRGPLTAVPGEAFIQAMEVAPGRGQGGATPVCIAHRNLLRNAGFEQWGPAGAAVRTADTPTPASAAPAKPPLVGKPDAAKAEVTHAPLFPAGWQLVRSSIPPSSVAGANAAARARAESAEEIDAVWIVGRGKSRIWQDVAVRPGGAYRGSVLVSARSGDGKGFPQAKSDWAGLILEELDAAGKVVALHPKALITKAGSWHYLSTCLTAKPNTTKIRFVLDTTLDGGAVGYDGCVLDGPPAPATLVGKVIGIDGRPVAGALVDVCAAPIPTDANGLFKLDGLSDLATITFRVEKQGYYPLLHSLQLTAGENRRDVVLSPLPTKNLLQNGDFEQGFPAARGIEHGLKGVRGPWSFDYAPGPNCYIYPESVYDWRKPRVFRGKESISHVTDGGGRLALRQEVAVNPNTPLVAWAWVQGLDVNGNGKGFGADPNDFAGFVIEELDTAGQVVVAHQPVGIRKATPEFRQVREVFTTSPKTARVRFTLRSVIAEIWQQAAAIYDDCALEPIAAEKPPAR